MSAALDFQPASELVPASSREEALEELISKQSELPERLQDDDLRALKSSSGMKPEEKQRLVLLLSYMASKVQELEAERDRQARDIEDLRQELSEMHETIIAIRNFSKEAIGGLKSEVASCNQLLNSEMGRLAEDIAQDRRRITALENPEHASETNQKRAAKIRAYAAGNASPYKFIDRRSKKQVEGRVVKFELLRLHLDCDKWQLNRALATLIKMYPGEYCKKKLKRNKWFLVELPKL
jgi:outer membrane murein-binding lipoprotein Lpp